MRRAMDETDRRRRKQIAHNETHGITPRGIQKAVTDIMEGAHPGAPDTPRHYARVAEEVAHYAAASPEALAQKIKKLEQQMYEHARNLEFEEAARLRDEIRKIQEYGFGMPA
jgi:excinuclease ABC subunit B